MCVIVWEMMTMSYNVVFVLVKPRWVLSLYSIAGQEREVEGVEEEIEKVQEEKNKKRVTRERHCRRAATATRGPLHTNRPSSLTDKHTQLLDQSTRPTLMYWTIAHHRRKNAQHTKVLHHNQCSLYLCASVSKTKKKISRLCLISIFQFFSNFYFPHFLSKYTN